MTVKNIIQTLEVIKYAKVKFEINKLSIEQSITVDEWKDVGKRLSVIEGSIQFWIGDWAKFGEKTGFLKKYTNGEVYNYLGEITGLKKQTLQVYKSVSDKCLIRIKDLDPVLVELEKVLEEVTNEIKIRKDFLKTVPQSGIIVTDKETGETSTLYPPSKSSTSSYKVTLAR